MRAWLYSDRTFLYPEEGIDEALSLSTFYGILYGYSLSGKKSHVDRPSGVYSVDGTELYENDLVEIRYDLTRIEILSGMKPVIRGWIEFEDGSFVAVNHDDEWLEYLGNDLAPNCNYYVKIIGNRHENQRV